MADDPAARGNREVDPVRPVGADGSQVDRPADHPPESFEPMPCVDGAGRVVSWVRCRTCGYNLFGLDAAGRCPECGAGIDQSTVPSLIRSLPSAFLTSVIRGTLAGHVGLASLGLLVPSMCISPVLAFVLLLTAGVALLVFGVSMLEESDAVPMPIRKARADAASALVIVPLLVPFLGVYIWTTLPVVYGGPGGDTFASLLVALFFGLSGVAAAVFIPPVLLHPITAYTRFLIALFQGGRPAAPERTDVVHGLVRFTRVLLCLASLLIATPYTWDLARVGAMIAAISIPGIVIGAAVLWMLMLESRRELRRALAEARVREQMTGPVE